VTGPQSPGPRATGPRATGTVLVGNAPCSYGAFEITVGVDPRVPEGQELLDHVAEAGYAGIDLGPVDYLGTGDNLGERLAHRGLALAGGYVPLAFSDPVALGAELSYLDSLLDIFDACRHASVRPKPTLADAGSPARRAAPGQAARRPELGLDDAGWKRFADGVARAVDRCQSRGYEATFHHHFGTYVEAVWEIERVLELTEVGLCLDTGHLFAGGGDPVQGLRDWADRVNHVHVKDVHRSVLEQIIADQAPVEEIWRRRAFCALGQGDAEAAEVIKTVREIGYAGWLIVEQDIFPDRPGFAEQARADQVANRAWLGERGL
jgi:inosose dehydratase